MASPAANVWTGAPSRVSIENTRGRETIAVPDELREAIGRIAAWVNRARRASREGSGRCVSFVVTVHCGGGSCDHE